MIGREFLPYDRGKLLLWPLQFFSWLSPHLFHVFWIDYCPFVGILLVFGAVICSKIYEMVKTWYYHFWMASVVADWLRSDMKAAMRKAGIRFRPTPRPPRFFVFPRTYMVLSAIMMSMWSVAMAGHLRPPTPVTWTTAWQGPLGMLDAALPPLTKPPDPDPPLDGEGDTDKNGVNPVEDPYPEDMAELQDFDISVGSYSCFCPPTCASCKPVDKWVDFDMHAAQCFFTSWYSSFSPLGLLSREDDMKALVDSCASVTVTPYKDDFVEYQEIGDGKVLKGITAGAKIKGRGIVHWNVEVDGKMIELNIRALHVPEATCRLLCPQQLKKELLPKKMTCTIEDDGVRLQFDEGVLHCPYNESNLPELILSTPQEAKENLSALSACVMLENNQNLTVAQKELLKWHCRLGHLSLIRVQLLMKSGALGHNPRIKAAANLDLSKFPVICGACAYGKAKRKSTRRSKTDKDSSRQEKELSKEILIPGQKVSMDHFIVSTPGRSYNSRGSDSHDKMFKGGVIFVDHASGYVFVVPVVNFTAGEAIRAKREFEQEMASMGVVALHYHTDNGVFTTAEFQDELAKLNQGLSLSGVGAHHQNAVAERAIGTVVSLARTMMLHSKMRWPKGVSTKLWPMAMKHAEFIVNHVPNLNNVCPLDVVLKTVVPRHQLKNLHVWGSPCYVLDPKLQDGKKIPKFEPRSRQGLNLGWSPKHASTVPLVLNMTTGHISPQFHVLYDDWFTTVGTDAQGDPEPIDDEKWTELLGEERFQFDGNEPVELEDEWLSELERVEKHQRAEARVRSRMPGAAPTAVPLSHEVDAPVNGTTVPVVPPANSAPPPSTVVEAPLEPAGTGVPAVATTPIQTRSQTQKIDSSRKQRENPVPEISSLPTKEECWKGARLLQKAGWPTCYGVHGCIQCSNCCNGKGYHR